MRGDGEGGKMGARMMTDLEPPLEQPTLQGNALIGLRVSMPEGVRIHEDAHVNPCLLVTYTSYSQAGLIETLERAIEAIRRGAKR